MFISILLLIFFRTLIESKVKYAIFVFLKSHDYLYKMKNMYFCTNILKSCYITFQNLINLAISGKQSIYFSAYLTQCIIGKNKWIALHIILNFSTLIHLSLNNKVEICYYLFIYILIYRFHLQLVDKQMVIKLQFLIEREWWK